MAGQLSVSAFPEGDKVENLLGFFAFAQVGTEADDEMRQSPLRLRIRSYQASRALFRTHLQSQWENGQCEALAQPRTGDAARIGLAGRVQRESLLLWCADGS